jgi:hypothetical protein
MTKTHNDIIWIDNIPWGCSNKILTPLNMPHTTNNVNRFNVKKALKETGALFAQWVDCWDTPEPTEWWWVCCDNPEYDVEALNDPHFHRGRRNIRKALKSGCIVKAVDSEELAKNGYQLYHQSMLSYGYKEHQIPSQEKFQKEWNEKIDHKNYKAWAVYYEDQMAAYALVLEHQDAVSVSVTKSDNNLVHYNPNTLLYYSLSKHYLNEKKVKYITNGNRTLLHPTAVNDFLERMGYRKIYCRLNVELNTTAKIVDFLKPDSWGKYVGLPFILKNQWDNILAFRKLSDIAKSFSRI